MAVVDIVIPVGRQQPTESHSALANMILATVCRCGDHAPWKCTRGKHSVWLVPTVTGSSVVHWSRNKCMTTALYGSRPQDVHPGRPPADLFFLMDDDMIANPGDLCRLISSKRDIVTGIATVRRDPPRPNIRYFKETEKNWWHIDKWDWESNKLFEVGAVGAAYMLVHRKVFDVMSKAYLNCFFEHAADKRKYPDSTDVDEYWKQIALQRHQHFQKAIAPKGDWQEANCWWFQFLNDAIPGQMGEFGEDISFCWKARQLGFKIWADPQVLPGHLGNYAYSVQDHREFVETRIANGDPVYLPDGTVHGVDTPTDNR